MTTATTTAPAQRAPELVGQTVVAIGGSAGIGLGTARRGRAEGAEVIRVARNPERLEQVARELGALSTAACDATDSDRRERFFKSLPAPIYHVIVTAGGPTASRWPRWVSRERGASSTKGSNDLDGTSAATRGDTVGARHDRKPRYILVREHFPRTRRGLSPDCCFAWLRASRTARIRRPERTTTGSAGGEFCFLAGAALAHRLARLLAANSDDKRQRSGARLRHPKHAPSWSALPSEANPKHARSRACSEMLLNLSPR